MSELAIKTASLPPHPTPREPRTTTNLQVRGKLREVIELMVFEGLAIDKAAAKAGMTTHAVRQALGKPHVIAHLKARRQVLREAICGSNIHRLAEIRDAADNMPAIQAIRTLEQLGEDDGARNPGASPSSGVTIRIINQAPASPTMIDVSPTNRHATDTRGEIDE